MKRIRPIGLAFTMVCAASAIVAASASAKPFEFRAEEYPVEVRSDGARGATFEFGGVPVRCSGGSLATNEEGAPNPTKDSSTLEVHPKYYKCFTLFPENSEVRTTGCNYLLTAIKPGEKNGPIQIKCEKLGEAIEVEQTLTGCVFKIGPQITAGMEYVNEAGPPTRVHYNVEAKAIKWTGSGACGPGVVEGEGTYRESAEFNGFIPGTINAEGLEVSAMPPR